MLVCIMAVDTGSIKEAVPVMHALTLIASPLLAALIFAAFVPGPARAQAYPSRAIHMAIGFSPGGPTDVLGRVIAPRLGEALGQPVIVDNRPGAGGNIAAEAIAKSPADGYALLFGDISFTVNPSLFKSLPFNPQSDFAPVGFVAASPQVLIVPAGLEPKSVTEFIAWAKSRPGQLSYGSAGNGTPPHLAAELFKAAHGLDIQAVHYKGAGPAMTDVIGGRLQMMIVGISASKSLVDSGKVRGLAIGGTRRAAGLPGVPTFAEAGAPLPELDLGAWWGVFAPAATPRDIVMKLNEGLARALAQPELRVRLAALQMEPAAGTPEAFGTFVRQEAQKWARVIERAKIVAE